METQVARFAWQGREVVRELDGRPHLLLRVDVRGGPFPQRALEPVARIVADDGKRVVASWFATISDDGGTLSAYFPLDVPDGGVLEVGYFPTILWRLAEPFQRSAVKSLDRERLEPAVTTVTRSYLSERGIPR